MGIPNQPIAQPQRPRSRRRHPLALFGFSVVIFALLLLALELIGRVCIWTMQIPTEFKAEPFHGFGETDPLLWWVLQPNLDTESQRVRLRTNRLGFRDERQELPTEGMRIFCLGDSTTFGLQVQSEEMYSALAEGMLRGQTNRPITVVSTGVPGYTSYQMLQQFQQKILPLHPNIVCVFASNNECRARMLGDRERGQKLERKLAIHRALGWSHFCVLVARGPEALRRSWELNAPPGRVANKPDEYLQNLRELNALAREHQCKVVLMTIPIRPRFKPAWQIFDRPSAEVAALLSSAQQSKFAGGPVEQQEEALLEAVRVEPKQFAGHWRLAQLYDQLGRQDEAERHFLLAREGDLHPEAAKPSYNRALREMCEREQIPLIDLEGVFAESGLPEAELFLDHCHPTPTGHRIIAYALSGQLILMIEEEEGPRRIKRDDE